MIVHLVDGRVKGFASRNLMLGVAADHMSESVLRFGVREDWPRV